MYIYMYIYILYVCICMCIYIYTRIKSIYLGYSNSQDICFKFPGYSFFFIAIKDQKSI